MEASGQNPRKAYQRRLPGDTSKDYYFIHRNTGITEPIIVEYGFLDSTGNDVSQLKNNWRNLAEAVVKAVANYSNVPYDLENESTYIVKNGDTLWSIAKKYNITVNELKNLNNLTNNLLSVGQVLKVSDYPKLENDNNTYIVRSGDTLYSVASKYGISVDELKRANNLISNILSIGQILTIPTKIENMDNEIVYVVRNGDTLYSIARNYDVSVNDIKIKNNLVNNTLSIGQTLIIPSINESKDIIDINSSDVTYTIKKGDSLYSIARQYGISVNDIMNYNNLTSNLLSIGQVLKVPNSSVNNFYTVKKGDTLYSIARDNNTSVDNIKSKNNLQNNILSIGQTLII